MADTTPNLGLRRPATTDAVNVTTDISDNMTAIDTAVAAKAASADVVTKALVDAKGDLLVATAADTVARLAVGTNDYVLTADSAQAAGVKWAAQSGTTVPCAVARRNSDQSINNTTWTLVSFNTEVEDNDGMFTTAAGDRMTVVTAGLYLCIANADFTANGTGGRIVALAKGVVAGAGLFAHQGSMNGTGLFSYMSCSGIRRFTAGETCSAQVYQSSGGALNLVTVDDMPSLSMLRVGP